VPVVPNYLYTFTNTRSRFLQMWITNSAEAELFLVFATVDPSKGYKGITCFLVEKDSGVQIAKKEMKLGIRASSTCTLNFDDLRVPANQVIGEVGKGYKIAIEILNEGRIGIAAQMLGLAQGAYNKSVKYAYERKQFGQPVGEFQAMQVQFAEAATEIEGKAVNHYTEWEVMLNIMSYSRPTSLLQRSTHEGRRTSVH
jgi:short/branched chain acyl-CoA dehydrogenase